MTLVWPSSSCRLKIALVFTTFFLTATSRSQDQTLTPDISEQPKSNAPTSTPASAKNLFVRWANAYKQDWHPDPLAPALPALSRRAAPSPLDSTPFPNADWLYGGSPNIGAPDTNTYPLMSAINGARSRIKLMGWVTPSFNLSTSKQSNYPVADNLFSNRIEFNRAVLIVERLPDTVQHDHLDWGFHLTNLFGSDYRFNVEKGALSSQLLDHNQTYGYDTPFDYFDLYIPKVALGMNIRVGRFASLPGIETQIPPFNYMFSHSFVYVTAPVTDTGIVATVKLSDQWLVQLGMTGGHDVALWSGDATPSLSACVHYTSRSVNDNLYLCANGINNGHYAYNNVQQYDATWYHKFSKTIHMATETWYMYENGVPAVSGLMPIEKGTNGAYCRPGQVRCTAPAYAIVNYLQKQLSSHDFISLRTDFLNDKKGQRTGIQTRYYENTLGWTHWFGTTVQLRPEIRFDHSLDARGYDNGTHRNQFTVATDLVYHF